MAAGHWQWNGLGMTWIPATGWEGMTLDERKAWVHNQTKQQIMSQYGLSDAEAEQAIAADPTADRVSTIISDAAKNIKSERDAKESAAKKERFAEESKIRGRDALNAELKRLQEAQNLATGDIARRSAYTNADIERMKAETYGGSYRLDTNGDGIINEQDQQITIDPRLATAGRTATEQLRSDNARGLLSSTLSQGATARSSDALNRTLAMFTGGKQQELADYTGQTKSKLADEEAALARAAATEGEKAGVTYKRKKDPLTGELLNEYEYV